MSADLFAEFNHQPTATGHALPGSQDPQDEPPVSNNSFPECARAQSALSCVNFQSRSAGRSNSSNQTATGDGGDYGEDGHDDDGWGDFEVAESAPPRHTAPDPPQASNVLFDVDDFELQDTDRLENADTDEFGDFELPASPSIQLGPSRRPSQAATTTDLLDIDQDSPLPSQAASPRRGALQASKASSTIPSSFTSLAGAFQPTKRCIRPSSLNDSIEFVSEKSQTTPSTDPKSLSSKSGALHLIQQGWGSWDEPTDTSVAGNNKKAIDDINESGSWDWSTPLDSNRPSIEDSSSSQPPPVNIPPPSVILSVFPDLFSCGEDFFKSLAGNSAAATQKALAASESLCFLQSYLLLGTTAARVIAGRKQRWQRDKFLAKSMSISASGSKGMKLAGVDKTQTVRESREAADVIAAWRRHIGRLRAAIATTNTSHNVNLRVPELNESFQIQVEQLSPTAPAACRICGLKRQERVVKVDFDVQDSFGKWWVEHWGHRACKNFWLEHEHRLRQR